MPQSIFTLLTQLPGNLVYHLILAFSLAAGLYSAFGLPRSPSAQRRRILFGFGCLLVIQLGLFLSSALIWQAAATAHELLPPLDRSANLLSLVGMVWLWGFLVRRKWADRLFIVLSIAILILTGVALNLWITWGGGLAYSITWLDFTGNGISILVAVTGMAWLVSRRPTAWGYGIASLALMTLAFLLQLSGINPPSDFSGIVRLAQLVAFPLLLALPLGFIQLANEPIFSNSNYSADPVALHSLLALVGETSSEMKSAKIARAVALTIRADCCLVLAITSADDEISLQSGYDRIQDTAISTRVLNPQSFPLLSAALLHGQSLSWTRQSAPPAELTALTQSIGYPNPAPLLLAPVLDPNKKPVGGFLLISPYSEKIWSAEDLSYLNPFCDLAGRLILEAATLERPEKVVNKVVNEGALVTQSRLPIAEIEKQEPTPDLVANPVVRPDTFLEKELHKALVEVAHLHNSLAESNADLLRMQQVLAASRLAPGRQTEVLASLVQEMRQPISSLAGYADLLLQETIGSLSVMQRKFLERIKVSVARMQCLVDDLVQMAVLDSATVEPLDTEMNLATVIDQAVAYTSSQMREKNINLELVIPSHIPPFTADGDALEQVLIHLLQNAVMVTPNEGVVRLSAILQPENGERGAIRLQVTDHGGGIHPDDLQRVFSRLYRSVNIPIPGVGDTGVGLSIAKTLVEAMGGRIWVESQMGESASFHVLLPVDQRDPHAAQNPGTTS